MISILGQRIRRAIYKGAKDTSGTATVEALIWLPFLFGFFIMVVDVSFIFHGQAQAYRIVQDANRKRSIGLFDNLATENYIEAQLSNLAPSANAATSVDVNTGIATTTLVVPTTDLMAVGFWDVFNVNLRITSSHYVEYY